MVVVMPAFTQSNQGQKEAVPAVVRSFEPAIAPQMAKGIDRKGSVVKENGGQEETPGEGAQPALCAPGQITDQVAKSSSG